jgi:hypothetical protein
VPTSLPALARRGVLLVIPGPPDLQLESTAVPADRYQPHAGASSVTFAEPPRLLPLLEQYSKARFKTDRYLSDGVRTGDVGWIVEIYGPGQDANIYAPCWGYEMEFMTSTGQTTALLGVRSHEVEPEESLAPE